MKYSVSPTSELIYAVNTASRLSVAGPELAGF